MGKPDVSSITTFECRSILDSIQNEYEQYQREDSILSKLHEDLAELITQRSILAKRTEFNEKYCILCYSAFNLLFKRKVFCQECHFWICRSCSLWDNSSKQWICKVCEKQKVVDAESRAWICNRIKSSFRNFGAAKVLQSFCRMKRISDSENDSGYGTASDFMPLMKLLSSCSLNKDLRMADVSSHDEDCEEDDEEELAEIHHSIETILEGLLGGALDDASVDHLYPNSCLYLGLLHKYHNKLVEVIQNLSKALQKALHNLPAENGITPTTAHAALKNVISMLVEDCQDLPPLQYSEQGELDVNANATFDYADVFSSYDSLVAAAVVNKVIEESQSRFKNHYSSLDEGVKIQKGDEKTEDECHNVKNENEGIYIDVLANTGATGFDMPIECVQIEEIEEITQEFTDSEDDKLSSISKWSNSLQSIEEVGVQKHSDPDLFVAMDFMNEAPTPFPEFGCDLVDDCESKDCGITCHPTAITSWEENWLFRKKKRLPLYSNLKYQLLTYCDEPPCMLVPCPSESSDAVEQDQDEISSELSETHSAGSLEFSSDPDDTKSDTDNTQLNTEVCNKDLQKSLKQTFPDASPVLLTEECSAVEILKYRQSKMCQEEGKQNDMKSKVKENLERSNDSLQVKSKNVSKNSSHSKNEERFETPFESPISVEPDFIATPPRPGTIAEREHKKWLNAVPLKNNPYSAENIFKRNSYSKKSILNEPISSFEEFERRLSVASDTSSTASKKVNCGPKSIDTELYKRDYYVNQGLEYSMEHMKTSEHVYALSDDCFEALSEEALNSFEEKVYISSGKVFTLENHVKRLEREVKDLSPSSEVSYGHSFPQAHSQASSRRVNGSHQELNVTSDDEGLSLPSVKCLATKFIPDTPCKPSQDVENKLLVVSNKIEPEKIKKSRPCMKVHSLTARSLSREFRDLAKQNLPKPMNRTILQVPSQSFDEGTSERESLCSPESVQSSFSTTQVDNGHGYTSDESNTSTSSIPCSRNRRHISRSILQRASYWERRAEQGLLSDASVSEEFPGIDINPE